MQHNNNNNIEIADHLNRIASNLSNVETSYSKEVIYTVETEILSLDKVSQKLDILEIRALAHWMLLNIEATPKTESQINILLAEGSYYKWMNILASLISQYDQTQLPVIYKALTEPNWIVKPSAPLLHELACWIESSRASTVDLSQQDDSHNNEIPADETIESSTNDETDDETNINAENVNDVLSSSIIDISEPANIFEEIDDAILEKNYEESDGFTALPETNDSPLTAEESDNFYDPIEAKLDDAVVSDTDVDTGIKTPEVSSINFEMDEIQTAEEINTAVPDISTSGEHPSGEFSDEADDIIMTLASISVASIGTGSENVVDNTDNFIAELQRFEMLADISGYTQILPISAWCQQNVKYFASNPIEQSRSFMESGEAWTWIELVKIAVTEPEELSTLSELSTELNRDEWVKPLDSESMQSLLLFLQNPNSIETDVITDPENTEETELKNTTEAIKLSSTNENSDYSFRWDEDIHPELLEVYFDETIENIADITRYLQNIGSNKTTKQERQDARRTAHTIKGGSAVVGITALSTYAYQLEIILDHAIDHTLPDDTNVLLEKASSCISALFSSIKSKTEIPAEFSNILPKLIHVAESLDDDDEVLELTAPVLPDFITQQNSKENSDTSVADTTKSKEMEALKPPIEKLVVADLVAEALAGKPRAKENISEEITSKVSAEATSVDENIDEHNIEKLDIEDIVIDINAEKSTLPTLTEGDDLGDFTAGLDDIVMTLVTTDVQVDTKPFDLEPYITELQRLDMLSEISGFPEVAKVSHWYQENLMLMAEKSTNISGEFISSGESWLWIELTSACLANPEDITNLSSLSAELFREEWPKPLEISDLQLLLLKLKESISEEESLADIESDKSNADNNINAVENTERAENESKELENTSSIEHIDNSDNNTAISSNKKVEINTDIISWDDDVHPELLSVYLQETSEQVSKIAELLHLISKGKANKDQQQHAARIAHTIKGASGVVGVAEIVDLTHRLEDILDYAVNNKIPAKTSDLLAESSDCLESLFEAVQEKKAIPEEFSLILEKLTLYSDFIATSDNTVSEEIPELNMQELPAFVRENATKSTTKNITKKSTKNSTAKKKASSKKTISKVSTKKTNKQKASQDTEESSDTTLSSATESHIRVPTALINKLLNLAGELVTTSSQISDKVEKTLTVSSNIKAQDKRVHNMLDELTSTIHKQEKDQLSLLSSMQNKDFDSLEMDTYNELHSVTGLLTESILDSETIESTLKQELGEIQNDLRTLDNLNKELSETILSSRMESLNTLIPRLERIVRQTCRKTDKEAELVVTGKDINIDTEILTGLADPLLHLLRNAIDHGIETPKTRKSKKKESIGKIHLNFSRQGNFIHMQLKDDGAGIDSENIYQHAIEKGIITPEQEFSASEVLKLILQPGFSTQSNVTDISGRGVGMDVVNRGIESLKGSLNIKTSLGEGTTFDIKIPLTLVTSSTLLVSADNNQVAIPTDSIDQLFYLTPEDVITRKEEHFILHQGKELVIESLAGILGWQTKAVDFSKAQTLLLIQGPSQLHAIYIDKIISSREVVIKSLAHFIDSSKGIIGACHLSDGAVAPVINLHPLLSLTEQSSYVVKELQDSDIETHSTSSTPQILVVDDSLSNRKALSLIIEKTDCDVITAVDGLDALNVMNEMHIDLVFTDLEMPRMTGLELTQAIRAWDEKKDTPIVMVTSRSTNKHRELAKKAGVDDYLTKPVATEALLESIEKWLKQTTATA